MNQNPSIDDTLDEILEGYARISDNELGEDKFQGHYSTFEAKEAIKALLNEARIEELSNTYINSTLVSTLSSYANDEPMSLRDRIEQLSNPTQENRSE